VPLDEGITPVEEKILPVPVPPASTPPSSPRHGSGGILALVNGVLTTVGGVYISTRSVLITVVAALTAVALAAIVLLSASKPARGDD